MIGKSVTDYFADAENNRRLDALLKELELEKEERASVQDLEGKTFVITGSLMHFENREQLKEAIEARGGKVASAVSKKTDYLINNAVQSGSSKNRKARELGIPVISEEDYLAL